MDVDWTVRQVFDMEKTLASIPYPDPKCRYVYYVVSLVDRPNGAVTDDLAATS